MQDDSVVLLTRTGQEAGDIHEGDDRNIEGVAEAHEAGTLTRSVAVENTCQLLGLVGNDTHTFTVETGKTYDDVLGKVRLHLEELTAVHDAGDDLVHVIRHVGVVGDNLIEVVILAVDGVCALHARGLLQIVLGDVAKQLLKHSHSLLLRLGGEMGHTALGGVYAGATQFLLSHHLAQDGLHHGGASEEHIRSAFHHQREVGESGAIDGATGTGTEDTANLRNHTAGHDVTLEDFRVTGQSVDALLNASATRVIQTDDGSTHLHGVVHHLANLLSHRLAERAGIDCEVLSEDIDQATVYRTVTSHYAVAHVLLLLHAEVVAAMCYEHVHFLEAAFVEQHGNALASGVLATFVLLLNGLLAATHAGFGAELNQLLDSFCLLAHCNCDY